MKLLQGMKVKIGNTYADDYGYDDIINTVCIYKCLYMLAYESELADQHEVHEVEQLLSGRHHLTWYVRKGDIHLVEPVTNDIGTFYLKKEGNI
jgi:hypothetical protein